MSIFTPHHWIPWLAGILHRARFVAAAVNPVAARKQAKTSQADRTNSAVMDCETDDIHSGSITAGVEMKSSHADAAFTESTPARVAAPQGALIVNADDWGRDHQTTKRIRECVGLGTVSSVSAMVFMEDSERAAALARERPIDAGLHLNFTTPFSAPGCPARLLERQQKLSAYLLRHRLAQTVFHPGLIGSFEYVMRAQGDEFCRLYGDDPKRLDGHHHMHLCANVLFGGLMAPGSAVRRNFSFEVGEKSLINRLYRRAVDRRLVCRYRISDFLFSLMPLDPVRLERIFSLARHAVVEVETHPGIDEEFQFLAGGEIFRHVRDLPIASSFSMPEN